MGLLVGEAYRVDAELIAGVCAVVVLLLCVYLAWFTYPRLIRFYRADYEWTK